MSQNLTPGQIAELRTHAIACEVVRAAGRGEKVDETDLRIALRIVNEAAQPLSDDEQQHRDAMFQLVADADRAHRLAFPREH